MATESQEVREDLLSRIAHLETALCKATNEAEQWKRCLLYYAQCEQATAEGYARKKSTSAGERRRHSLICRALVSSIRDQVVPGRLPRSDQSAGICADLTAVAVALED